MGKRNKNKNKYKNKKASQAQKPQGPSQAQLADRHYCYEKAVQDPETDLGLVVEKYELLKGRKPVFLREDFCGTANLSVQWCLMDPNNRAMGVDLCGETLAWGKQHNLSPVADRLGERLQLHQANVLEIHEPKADVTCAFNFSYNIFKTREALREYFESALRSLKSDGVLVMDVYGGTEALDELEEERDVEEADFTYVWEQERFNPITHDILCHIHFDFADGSRMEKAFTYDWRLWTLPELREILLEAGFQTARVFWERFEDADDDDDYLEATGEYDDTLEADNQESWVCYILAEA